MKDSGRAVKSTIGLSFTSSEPSATLGSRLRTGEAASPSPPPDSFRPAAGAARAVHTVSTQPRL